MFYNEFLPDNINIVFILESGRFDF